MATTYSTNLQLIKIGTGDQAGTWGDTTNYNIGTLIEQAISGYATVSFAGGDVTLTMDSGLSCTARNIYLELTSATAARTLTVPGTSPNANNKLYFIYNNSGYAITVKVASQTGVTLSNGTKSILLCNGTDIVNATSYVLPNIATSFTATQTFTGSSSTAATVTNNIVENTQISSTALTGTVAAYLNSGSVFYYNASTQTGNWGLNFRWSAGTTIDSVLSTGQTVTIAVIVNQGTTAYYQSSTLQIDDAAVTVKWQGGSAPTAGNASSTDVYTYSITKTNTSTYLVLGSLTKFA